MTTQTFDPIEYKEAVRSEWKAAAPGWKKRFETIEAPEGGQVMTRKLLEVAGLGPGDHLLDIASGYGEPGVTAAHTVGPDGRVVCQDISSGMLAFAAERADAAGLENVEFVEGDAEALDLDEESFDAVTCRFGLMYFVDPVGTLTRLSRFLKPGGRIALTTWSAPPKVPFAAVPFKAILETLELPPPPQGRPGIFALSDPDLVERHLKDSGFTDVQTGTVTGTFEVGSAEEWVESIQDTAPPITKLVEGHPPEAQQRAWDAVLEALRPFEEDGRLRLENEAIWAVGTK